MMYESSLCTVWSTNLYEHEHICKYCFSKVSNIRGVKHSFIADFHTESSVAYYTLKLFIVVVVGNEKSVRNKNRALTTKLPHRNLIVEPHRGTSMVAAAAVCHTVVARNHSRRFRFFTLLFSSFFVSASPLDRLGRLLRIWTGLVYIDGRPSKLPST